MSAVEKTPPALDTRTPVAWYPPPTHPPPQPDAGGSSRRRAIAALVAAILGLVLGLPLGVPGMILGTLAYFLGRSAVRNSESSGSTGGRGVATVAWVLGAVSMAIGSAVTLVWLVVALVVTSGPTTRG